jgi:hypothetical protein
MKTARGWAVLILSCAANAAGAGDLPDIEPGQWEVVTHMEMAGMPMTMPPMTVQHCLSAEDIAKREDELAHPASRDPNEKCALKHRDIKGNSMTMTMACKGSKGDSEVKGSIVFDTPTAYHGEFEVTAAMEGGRTVHMTQHFEAKRTGNCNK